MFFFVQRLELGDLLLRFLGVNGEKASASAPIARQNHHLHISCFSASNFDDCGGLVLGTGLKPVLARLDLKQKPATVGQAIHFLVIHKNGWFQSRPGEVMLTKKQNRSGLIFSVLVRWGAILPARQQQREQEYK